MKTLRPFLLGVLFVAGTLPLASHAQAYSPRQLTRRVAPQPGPVKTNTPTQARTPVPTPQPTPAVAPRPVATQAVVRIIQPPVDPEKARVAKEDAVRRTIEFQKKRAEEGSESAQYELGLRYWKGDGVVKDEATALKWLNLSSKAGYSPATRKLEELEKAAHSEENGEKPVLSAPGEKAVPAAAK